ncbi:amino acid racemase [Ruminococcus sp.]|uniref:aspartate/glutamate racemase family protein n=1 Tax=Ruminococcus sp. TaxID=41978 RepID=UPI0025F3A5A8|nr:amino acid racemase [Ruminococcus sp.]MBQ8966451.1 amino acid racemase [Ruminococcus sp.]
MRKLGLIGGTGYESTLVYYRELNRKVNKKCGGRAFPEMAIESLDLYKALELVAAEDYEGLTAYIMEKLNALAAGGADFAALTAGTMHIVFDRLKDISPLPLAGIPEAVCERAKALGFSKVRLLGTLTTMEKDFFKDAFKAAGAAVTVPPKGDRLLIHKRITSELEFGIVKESTRKELITVIENMRDEEGIEAVVLGCTELPLILDESCCPLPVLDIMAIHIDKLTELIHGEG